VAGGGEVRGHGVLGVDQHVVEGGIVTEAGDKFDGVGEFFRLSEAAAAGEKVVQGGLMLLGGVGAFGEGFGERAGVKRVEKKFAVGVRQAALGAEGVQDGGKHETGWPAGLLFEVAKEIGGRILAPADPLQEKFCQLIPRHFFGLSNIWRTLARKASG